MEKSCEIMGTSIFNIIYVMIDYQVDTVEINNKLT